MLGKDFIRVSIETFAGKVTKAVDTEDYKTALILLKKRPGELARKLDYLLRNTDDKRSIINTFKDVAAEVSTPVLLQVKEHFAHRTDKSEARVFFPKGNLARCYCIENILPEIDEEYCNAAVKICENALIGNYRTKAFPGNVYLSDEFKQYMVPFSQRSAGKTLKTVVRGSKLPVASNTKALRAFIWWTNMGDDYKRGQMDIDIESVVKYGARYVVYQVYSYTGQKYSDMPHAMFGWMGREDVKSGEIYEPETVEQKMDLISQSTVCIPVIFDCIAREVIWCNMSLSLNGCHSHYGGNNVESNLSGVAAACCGMVNMSRPNLYDLIDLHVRARGSRVDSKEDADIIFDVDSGITPSDTEIFMGEYL